MGNVKKSHFSAGLFIRASHCLGYHHDMWPANSPDLNPVDYGIWGMMQERVYRVPIQDVDKLRQRLVETWAGLQQSVVDEAIDQWRKRLGACVHAQGGHFEHSQ